MTTSLPSPDNCERIFHAALAAGDMRGVVAALEVMAPQDPERADRLYKTVELALRMTRSTTNRVEP